MKTQRLYWKRADYHALARGETAESLVSLTYVKVRTGERAWNRQQYPDLEDFLKSVLDSLISNLVRSVDNRKVEKLPEDPERLDALLKITPITDPAQHMNPERQLLAAEARQREEALVEAIEQLIGTDAELRAVWHCIEDGAAKSQAIAEQTGLPIAAVYQLRRKLKSLLTKLMASPQPAAGPR